MPKHNRCVKIESNKCHTLKSKMVATVLMKIEKVIELLKYFGCHLLRKRLNKKYF
jgi:hypothetical protein